MSNLPAAVQTSVHPSPTRALAPAAPAREGRSADVLRSQTVSQRQDAPARFRARTAPEEARGSRAGPRSASAPPDSPPQAPDGRRAGAPFAAATSFVAQVLGQAPEEEIESPLLRHRDGPSLGSEAYRRAGGDPPVYTEAPSLFRLAV